MKTPSTRRRTVCLRRYFRSYFAGSMAEVDSRMKDLMDIGISHDKSLEGLVNDLAATCTDVPRLKGLARFLGYGGMDEYELAARLYDRCLDVHLTSLNTARTLWRDNTCLLYTSPSPRDATLSRMPSSA